MSHDHRVSEERSDADALAALITAAPSPFHAISEAAALLDSAGFSPLDPGVAWESLTGAHYIARGGALVAWLRGTNPAAERGFRVVGAHSDSPNLRVKPRPDAGTAGCRQVTLEPYGSVLLNSWLDRDLGLSGRVTVRGPEIESRLLRVDDPILRIPQLAIHLDREVNESGLRLNRQDHLSALWSLGELEPGAFRRWVAAQIEAEPEAILAWDLMAHDVNPVAVTGPRDEFISGARLDNLCSSFVAVQALVERAGASSGPAATAVVCLFDHEEVGSTSDRGAVGPLLATVLEREILAAGGTREDWHRAMSRSVCVSADMAHATHPNYADRHDADHPVAMNGGPVIKTNVNQRYATDAASAAVFAAACTEADVPVQHYLNRSDLPCGSTIGPLTAAATGMATVDVGMAQLAMHSAREISGAADPGLFRRALTAFMA